MRRLESEKKFKLKKFYKIIYYYIKKNVKGKMKK